MAGGWLRGSLAGRGWLDGVAGWRAQELDGVLVDGGLGLEGCRSWIEGWMEEGWREVLGGLDGGRLEGGMDGVKCGSVRAVRFCVSVQRFAVFAVHRGGRFLAFRFRFAVRFAAFLKKAKPLNPKP